MRNHGLPGLSVALAKNGRPVLVKAYGMADVGRAQPLTTDHVMRIASVSKPITAVAVLKLVEHGLLSLDRKVFGFTGVLGTRYGRKPYTPRLMAITVRHLLQHTVGAWGNDDDDPIFQHPEYTADQLITWVLDTYPLRSQPGTRHEYSNFGYFLLGRILEAVTATPYESFVKDSILRPMGIGGMRIAGYTEASR
jgi:D-alanyl-D-alanine carboxypeptidase